MMRLPFREKIILIESTDSMIELIKDQLHALYLDTMP